MAQITFKGQPVNLVGDIPKENSKAENFKVVKPDLTELSLSDLADKIKVLIAVPSLDTSVCAAETKKFSEQLAEKPNVEALVISKDLPFAMKRYMESNGIKNIIPASDFRYSDFVKKYNTEMADGAMKGLSARAVFVLDKDNNIKYAELVPEIAEEPQYDKVIEAVNSL